ncbi:DoxX family protein [Blastococcus sp. TF02A-26]|uniref:DoxX family protein n=1 Tax=Blastococcus sp. TF02A-26 TaxID=2250577 RepID=UPI000DEB5BBD|nr:MauE/DoxX family redox-associated membrane protein [Blastococcus sp. TF02A-26]RBY86906.1 DoxX family protein [Blastococcus sp. TF02A-26]
MTVPVAASPRRGVAAALPWAGTVLRVGLGVVWVVAGALKLPDPAAAERAVRAYQLAPEALVPLLAFGLPVLEIAVGLLLLAGVFVRPAAVVSALLLAGFTAAVASAWARGLSIDCGCFGGGGEVDADSTAYLSEIVRDVALLAASVFLVVRPRTRLALLDRAVPLRGGPDA